MTAITDPRAWWMRYANAVQLFHHGCIDEPMFRAWLLGMGFAPHELPIQVEVCRPRTPTPCAMVRRIDR